MQKSNLLLTITMGLLFTITACASSQKGSKLTYQTFTANQAGFSVNSHLIKGVKNAILVDAQFTRSQARKVISSIKETGLNLQSIYITQGHPDHHFGLELIIAAFPKAEVVARPEVIQMIKETSPGKIAYWKPIYKEELTGEFLVPSSITKHALTLEGKEIQIIDLGTGESAHDTALYVPSTKTLITGDAAFGGVHFWLADGHASDAKSNLEELKKLDVNKVLTGHGNNGDKSILDVNIKYIEKFLKVTKKFKSVSAAKKEMLKTYGEYHLPIILELALKATIK
jgi:glyoxylase-like metal-dependent hydrolase (beta-lactamase superfamily II)